MTQQCSNVAVKLNKHWQCVVTKRVTVDELSDAFLDELDLGSSPYPCHCQVVLDNKWWLYVHRDQTGAGDLKGSWQCCLRQLTVLKTHK